MPSRPNPSLVCLFLGALFVFACTDSEGDERSAAAAPTTTFLLDSAATGEQRLAGPLAQPDSLLSPELDAWFGMVHDAPAEGGDELADEALAAFLAEADRSEGALSAGAAGGVWVQIVEVPHEREVVFRAQIDFEGIDSPLSGGLDTGARLGLAQLRRLPDELNLTSILTVMNKVDYTTVLQGDGVDVSQRLELRTGRHTRYAAVFCVQPLGLSPGARTVFRDVALELAGDLDRVAMAGRVSRRGLEPERPLVGRFTVGAVERPGLALLPAAEVDLSGVLPVLGEAEALELQFEVATVPWFGREPGATYEVRVVLTTNDGRELVRWDGRLEPRDEADARWERVALRLPDDAPSGAVRFTARAAYAALDDGLAVLANPRIVPRGAERAGPNVLLISLDTLRADRLGCYGHVRDTSPTIDALAERSLRFSDTWSNANFTLPAHASLFTGQMPSVHGAETSGRRLDPQRSPTLARMLHERGYSTAAFTGGGYVHPEFGFGDGFDRYGTLDPLANLESERVAGMLERSNALGPELVASQDVDAAVDWIERHADGAFLMFFHSYTVHSFDPPARSLSALGLESLGSLHDDKAAGESLRQFETPPDDVVERLSLRYDATVRHADDGVATLLDALERLGLADDTIVVLTSDHGKELGERGMVAHGHSLYEEMLQVPLIVHVPGAAAGVRDDPAMLVDVLPTLAPLLGLDLTAPVQGVDLLDGQRDPRALFAEVDDLAHKSALRLGDDKLIFSPLDVVVPIVNEVEVERFDLASDRDEQHALTDDGRMLDYLKRYAEQLAELAAALGEGADERGLPGDVDQALRELGYTTDK